MLSRAGAEQCFGLATGQWPKVALGLDPVKVVKGEQREMVEIDLLFPRGSTIQCLTFAQVMNNNDLY